MDNDLKRLQAQIQEYTKDKPDLPFPVEVVSKIKKQEVSFLQEMPGFPCFFSYNVFGTIFLIFRGINTIFLQDAKGQESEITPRSCLEALESLVQHGVPKSPLFLIVAEAYQSYQYKHRYLGRPKSQPAYNLDFGQDLFRMAPDEDFSKRTRIHAVTVIRSIEKLEQAVEELMSDQEDSDICPETGVSLPDIGPLPESVYWIRKHDFQMLLVELKKKVEKERKADRRMEKNWHGRDVPHSQSPQHNSDYLYGLLEAATELIRRHWKKRGAQKEAIRLFNLWGIEGITSQAAKTARQRRKRKGNKAPP
jgi:hypothetical protein